MQLSVVVSSSLNFGSLNNHIIREIVSSFPESFSVAYWPPDQLLAASGLTGVDLFLYVGSTVTERVPLHSLASHARDSGTLSVMWATEDPFEFDTRHRADSFDAYFSNDANAATSYIERPDVFHLPLAGARSDVRKIVEWDRRELGVVFAGAAYANRQRIVLDALNSSLANRNVLFALGKEWSKFKGLNTLEFGVDHDQLLDIYSQSRFTLNIGRDLDMGNEQRKLAAVTPGTRTFEAALAGSPQFYFRTSFEIEEHFVPGSEILVVDSVDEMWDLFHWYGAHKECWSSIAEAAQSRALREHLYEHRIDTMLATLRGAGMLE